MEFQSVKRDVTTIHSVSVDIGQRYIQGGEIREKIAQKSCHSVIKLKKGGDT